METFKAAVKADQDDQREQAESLFQRSIRDAKAALGADDLSIAVMSARASRHYFRLGRFPQAQALQEEALRIRLKQQGPNHLEAAFAMRELAITHIEQQAPAVATPLLQKSLTIQQKQLKGVHEEIAATASLLATSLAQRKQILEAAEMYGYALGILDQLPKANPAVRASTLSNLGSALMGAGMQNNQKNKRELLAMAEENFLKAIKIFESIKELKESADHGAVAHALAGLYMEQERFAEAEKLYAKVLPWIERQQGTNHLHVAAALNNMGQLNQRLGRWKQAESFYLRSLEIRKQLGSASNASTLTTFANLAKVYAEQGDAKQATKRFDEARRVSRAFLLRELPSLDYADQRNFISGANVETSDFSSLAECLSFAAQNAAHQPVVDSSAAWLINGKALTMDARQVALQPKLGLGSDWIDLADIRRSLPKNSVLIDIARIPYRRFAKASSSLDPWDPPRYIAWIVPADETRQVKLVDLGAADVMDDAVNVLRQKLKETADQLKQAAANNRTYDLESLPDLRPALQRVSELAWKPLSEQVTGESRIVLSPDAELWLVPWAALPMDSNRLLIQEKTLQFVISGRDLVARRQAASPRPAVIVADPDYDAEPALVTQAATRELPSGRLLSQEAQLRLPSRTFPGAIGDWQVSFHFGDDDSFQVFDAQSGEESGTGRWSVAEKGLSLSTKKASYIGRYRGGKVSGLQTWQEGNRRGTTKPWHFELLPAELSFLGLEPTETAKRLPQVARLTGTAVEADTTAKQLSSLYKQPPAVYRDRLGSEAIVKSLVSPRALVLATHGFVLPATSQEESGHPADDSLLRCGLLFAGVNRRREVGPGDEDGILTGAEILRLKLTGTQLVVLSACDTGLGDVHVGQGVSGIRQAFHLAGAANVMATLWELDDASNHRLMDLFYSELVSGKEMSEALAAAQRKAIDVSRELYGSDNPFFWAAFSMTESR